jgi:uncharacterized protein (DUF2236 family)
MPFRAVSAADLENELAKLRKSTPFPAQGLFGPGSANWKVNRESALFLAAGRAALLQLAHPWVATAIAQHSRTLNDPIGRFHHTFRVMFTMSFGSVEQAFNAARRLHRLHESICGTVSETAGRFGQASNYQANEVDALVWVFATLIESSLLAYELALPPLSRADRDQYYAEGRKSVALFGVSPDELPDDCGGFERYMRSALQSDMLGVSDATRQLAQQLQSGAGWLIRPPFWYRCLTTQLLPPRLRQQFGFSFGDRERNAAERALRWVRRIYVHLPPAMRFVGPYNEIQSRLNRRAAPGLAVRLSNRMWIGQPLLFANYSDQTLRQNSM